MVQYTFIYEIYPKNIYIAHGPHSLVRTIVSRFNYVFVKVIMKMVFTFALIKHLGRLLGKSQILEPFSIL